MLTMTDCSDADNRVQARYEMDRATHTQAVVDWFYKWARPLLDYADAAPNEDDVANELALAERVSDDNANTASERADTIRATISKLDAIVAGLENSL